MAAEGELRAGEDRLLALFLLLPAAFFAWPFGGGVVGLDPYPHIAGTGWLAVTCVPAAILSAVTRRLRRSTVRTLATGVLVAACLSASFVDLSDGFERNRSLAHLACLVVLLITASPLGAEGRRVLAWGLAAISVVLSVGALAVPERALAGTLGNTGALSQAALPGAVTGAWLAAGAGPGRWLGALGLVAPLSFAVHGARAPVLLGLLALVVALGLAAVLGRSMGTVGRRLALVGLGLVGLALYAGSKAGAETPDGTGALSADTAGAPVRLALWKRVPALVGDHPLLGVGPGQVQAAFPPYRDPDEIAASSHGGCSAERTEIDHLHNDLLQGWAEWGLVGGLLWSAFLGLCAWRALGAMAASDRSLAALGTAALALMGTGLAHSPWLFHPASAGLGFVLFGALSAPATPARRDTSAWLLPALALLVALLSQTFLAHGRLFRGTPVPAEAEALVESAAVLRAFPDDRATLGAWLAVRPHSGEALQRLALLELKEGEVQRARELYGRALELDPGHPRVLRNLAHLEWDYGTPAAAEVHLDALTALGCLEAPWLEEAAARLCEMGRGPVAFDLLARQDERFAPEAAEAELAGGLVHALSREIEAAGKERLAAGLESAAHHLWAREHAADGRFGDAVRSYRQAIRPVHGTTGGGPPLLRAELGAAQLAAGSGAEASATLEGLKAGGLWRAELAPWARDVLAGAGY